MPKRKLALISLIALLPLFTPTTVKAESYLVEEYVYEEVEVPMLGVGELAVNPADSKRLYDEWVVEQARLEKARQRAKIVLKSTSSGSGYCSCVTYAKSLTGYSLTVGNARNWPRNSKVPVVGGVVITNESKAGHVAVITSVNGNEFTITEANYTRCRKGTRTLNINNPVIIGYWQ